MDVRSLIAAGIAALLCGCQTYAVPAPITCPGERKGIFDFGGDLISSSSACFFAQPGNAAFQVNSPIAFQATVNFEPVGDGAAVCIDAPHVVPRTGTYQDLGIGTQAGNAYAITTSYVNATGSVGMCTCPSQQAAAWGSCLCPSNTPLQNCSCPVIVTEWIIGDLTRSKDGNPVDGFTGNMDVYVTPLPSTTEPPAQLCDCHVSCSYSYTLTARSSGTR